MRFNIIILLVNLVLITSPIFSQKIDTNFNKQWVQIDTLMVSKKLTKDALQQVADLYKTAKQQQNEPQIIKSLIYKIGLEDEVLDNKPNNAIATLNTEIDATNNVVAKCILYSLLANRYLQYYNANRWKFYNRSKTIAFVKNDIDTWGADDFGNTISDNFSKSIIAIKALQGVNISAYDTIIIKGNARQFRPTLFDLLAHEALDYFKTGDYYLTKPAYVFELRELSALADYETFSNTNLETTDSTSHLLKSLQLFQQLIQFHKNDMDKNALVDIDLERIEWVNNYLNNDGKDAAYLKALGNLTKMPVLRASQAYYLLASHYATKANSYQPFGNTAQRLSNVTAMQIISEALAKHQQDDEGVANLKNLQEQILQKSITTQTEAVNIPNKPFRVLVSFKNIDTLFVRVVKLTNKSGVTDKWQNSDFKNLVTLPVFQSFAQPLPPTKDYQQHSVEIKIDALPLGDYVLLTSIGAGFIDTIHKMSKQLLYVSNISYIKNGNDYFVVHRETGTPLSNVKVAISKENWNRKINKTETQFIVTKTTNKNGQFNFISEDDYGNYQFDFIAKNDHLKLESSEYVYKSRSNDGDADDYDKDEIADYEEDKAKVYFFTDRSIYRPGQTVYFKGVAITKDFKTKANKIFACKDSVFVYLEDANNKKIDSIYFKTNAYGSFSGKFIIPQNVLTGNFSVNAYGYIGSNQTFSVEEYKRPKFYVEFESVRGTYRLNDSITITGVAKAFAGNVVNGAKVCFNVQRNARSVYDWLWRNGSKPYSRNQQISNGEIVTDAEGKFKVTFKASPDETIAVATEPLFDFIINADVTDITGETRTANKQVSVGYKSLVLTITGPKLAEADSLKQITVATKNLNGEKEAAEVAIKIYAVQTPQRLIRKRLWQRADMFVMNKTAYLQYFPNDDYEDELNENTWAANNLVFQGKINTATNTKFQIPNGTITAGFYKIEATTTDKDGGTVKDIKYVQLFNRNATPYPQYNFNYTLNNYIQPNETAAFLSGSMATKIFVINKITRQKLAGKERASYSFNSYQNGLHNINYKADETDRGNVAISEAFVINNRVYTNQYNIIVPFNNKALDISYTSFRNKTEPGSKETWTVNIAGNKGEKVAAELLTSMYDASLDQFKRHEWVQPNIWISNNANNQFIGSNGFTTKRSNENHISNTAINFIFTVYDDLLKPQFVREYIIMRKTRDFDIFPFVGSNMGKFSRGSLSSDALDEVVTIGYSASSKKELTGAVTVISSKELNHQDLETDTNVLKQIIPPIQPRKNFNETAFFFPNLYADTSGNYSFSFTMPEALTQWKWQSLAHTKELAFGNNSATITTQKTLMVQANAPRFVREGDNLEFVAKLSNLSDKELTGQVRLELVDATTNVSVDGWFQNMFPTQYFTVAAGQSSAVKFPIQIPYTFNKLLTWRVIANAGNFSDGEENTLPVLSNRMLVTESLPMLIKGDTTQHFVLDKLINNQSETLTNQSLTVEYTANPIWTAVQALPYLIDYPYECAEQTFNRYFANALAANIVAKHPRIKSVFEQWQKDTTTFKSNLAKNEELKQVLLQETPWVLQAENEAQQQKNMALLFDVVKMSTNTNVTIDKLQQLQLPSGGFAWFKGGREDRYITNYILTGIGKLQKMEALQQDVVSKLESISGTALTYLDNELRNDYEVLKRNKVDLQKQQISTTQIQYLYMRSFYKNAIVVKEAYNYYYNQAKQFWNVQNTYNTAMIGLMLYRNNEQAFVSKNIVPAIVQNTVDDTAKASVYWKDRSIGFWYASPIEHQSMMLQMLQEVQPQSQDLSKIITAAKTWLLLHKQTNHWQTTVATAEACYALLDDNDSLNTSQQIRIQLGNLKVNTSQSQAGTGYFKTTIEGSKVTPQMGNITVTITSQSASNALHSLDSSKITNSVDNMLNNRMPNLAIVNTSKSSTSNLPPLGKLKRATGSISYGSLYWQYFEDFDKITISASPLSITKQLFVEKNSAAGKVLTPVKDNAELKVGDKVVIQLVLKTDRDMDYVHLKDTRAATMEPVNVLSEYKYQDGLGYYEATKDASTNFFFNSIKKGTYVFEYPVFISHVGVFSIGIANLQCMYAPEFTSHSSGMKISVSSEQ